MVGCCAFGCNNNDSKDKSLTFHRLPTATERKKQWAVKINRLDDSGNLWIPDKSSHRLCSVSKNYFAGFSNI